MTPSICKYVVQNILLPIPVVINGRHGTFILMYHFEMTTTTVYLIFHLDLFYIITNKKRCKAFLSRPSSLPTALIKATHQ